MNTVQTLLSGLAIGESARWHQGKLWFSNWGTQEIIAYDPVTNTHDVMLRVPTTLPFSIDWLPDGRLLVVSGPEKQLLIQQESGELTQFAQLGGADLFWNELVVNDRGYTYVNGVSFTGPGLIALVTPDGAMQTVADDQLFPNGMCLTPDQRTLIVAESHRSTLTAYSIADDGSLFDRRIWASLPGFHPDGICLDQEGAVWFADVPNACCLRVREGGEILQRIDLDRGGFSCMLGGADRRSLYILAAEFHGMEQMRSEDRTGQLLVAHVSIPGAGRP